jgi:hypothetical protein
MMISMEHIPITIEMQDAEIQNALEFMLRLPPSALRELKSAKKYEYAVNGKQYIVTETPSIKMASGDDYHYMFNKLTGDFRRWGRTIKDDPQFSPIGPEILDLEISVNGCPNACPFCYKNNRNVEATNMSFDMFKSIIDRFPKTLTQIAFGITGIKTNPDFVRMMEYCRSIGVIPNFTLSGIDLEPDMAKTVAKLVGALAVSAYQSDKNICYDTVKTFTDLGIKQTNIHLMVSEETLDFVYEVLRDRHNDPRLAHMNAIVFLGVKPKGRAVDGYHSLSTEKYAELVRYCLEKNLPIGFDSCSAPKFEMAVRQMANLDESDKQTLIQCSESCESSMFSAYINVQGEYWHCSFSERENEQQYVDVLDIDDFLKDLWYHPVVEKFRNDAIRTSENGCRRCNVFPSINP